MILQALSSYYDRLLKDPDEDVPEPGFSKEKIDFEILLGRYGALKAISNIQIQPPKGKKNAVQAHLRSGEGERKDKHSYRAQLPLGQG